MTRSATTKQSRKASAPQASSKEGAYFVRRASVRCRTRAKGAGTTRGMGGTRRMEDEAIRLGGPSGWATPARVERWVRGERGSNAED